MTDVDVMIRVATDAADAARGLDGIGDNAREMADEIDRASRDASNSLDRITDGADAVAGNASILAGAFGDIGAGLDAVGMGGFTDELEGASTALMFAAGVSDTLSVATNILSASKIKDTAATVANKAASIAVTTAQKAQAAAQWALNIAMSANPIMLVVLAVVALVAIIVVAYKRSETFRKIVQAVGRAGRAAMGWIIDKVRDLIKWVGNTAPQAWERLKQVGLTALRLLTLPIRTQISLFLRIVGFVKERIPEGVRAMKKTFVSAWEAMTAPIDAVVGLIKDVIKWIDKIDLGILEDIGGALGGLVGRTVATGRPAVSRPTSGTTTTTSSPSTVINMPITVNGALDASSTAQQIEALVAGRLRRMGITVTA